MDQGRAGPLRPARRGRRPAARTARRSPARALGAVAAVLAAAIAPLLPAARAAAGGLAAMTLYGTVTTTAGAPVTAGTVAAFAGGVLVASLHYASPLGAFGTAPPGSGAAPLTLPGGPGLSGTVLSFTVDGMAANASIVACPGTAARDAEVSWVGGADCQIALLLGAMPPAAAPAEASAASAPLPANGTATAGGPATPVPDTSATAAGGTGSVAVALYGSDPAGPTPAGPASGPFFGVSLAPLSTFSTVAVAECGLAAGSTLLWWDSGGWTPVSPQTAQAGAATACIRADLDRTTSSPTLAQLGGALFAVDETGSAGTPPQVAAVDPATGPAAGGIPVDIRGAGFSVARAVYFGTAQAPFSIVSDSEITAAEPAGAGQVAVTVAGTGGTSAPGARDLFRYAPAAPSVGAVGGLLGTPDGTFVMAVPAGSTAGGGSLKVAEAAAPAGGLPAGMAAASPGFTLSGAALASAVPATIRYTASALGGRSPRRLSVYARGPGRTWAFLPTAVNAGDGTVWADVPGPTTLVVLAATLTWPDVASGTWAAGGIDALAATGSLRGFPDGTFRPDAPVTRAQFVAMLARVLRLAAPPNGAPAPFTDVPAGAWYARYVAAAWAAGWIQGVSPTAFAPGSPVSREEMAVLVARALGLGGTAALPWTDAADVAPWAVAGVRAASAAGYLRGYPDGTFRPAADATRAEAAALLARVLAREAP